MLDHATAKAQRPSPETPSRLQQSLANHPNRPTAQRGGGSLQRTGFFLLSYHPLTHHRAIKANTPQPRYSRV